MTLGWKNRDIRIGIEVKYAKWRHTCGKDTDKYDSNNASNNHNDNDTDNNNDNDYNFNYDDEDLQF